MNEAKCKTYNAMQELIGKSRIKISYQTHKFITIENEVFNHEVFNQKNIAISE